MSVALKCKVCGSALNFRDEQGFLLCTTCFTQSQDFVPDEQEAQQSQGGHARARLMRFHDGDDASRADTFASSDSAPISFSEYAHGWCCLLQMLAAAADAVLHLGSMLQSCCHSHARALLSRLPVKAEDDPGTLQLSLASWSSLLPVDRLLHVMVCAMSALRCAVTCSDLLCLVTSNELPYVAGYASLPASVHRSLSQQTSPLRPRYMPSIASIAAGASRLAMLLEIEQPSVPVAALACRYSYYLQLPQNILAISLSLRVLLPSVQQSPSAPASLLFLAAALAYKTTDEAPCVTLSSPPPPSPPSSSSPSTSSSTSGSPPPAPAFISLRQLVHAAAISLDARAPPPILNPSAPEKCTHSPAAAAAATAKCAQMMQSFFTSNERDTSVFTADITAVNVSVLPPSSQYMQVAPLPQALLVQLLVGRRQVIYLQPCRKCHRDKHTLLVRLANLLAAASNAETSKVINLARDLNAAALKIAVAMQQQQQQ